MGSECSFCFATVLNNCNDAIFGVRQTPLIRPNVTAPETDKTKLNESNPHVAVVSFTQLNDKCFEGIEKILVGVIGRLTFLAAL